MQSFFLAHLHCIGFRTSGELHIFWGHSSSCSTYNVVHEDYSATSYLRGNKGMEGRVKEKTKAITGWLATGCASLELDLTCAWHFSNPPLRPIYGYPQTCFSAGSSGARTQTSFQGIWACGHLAALYCSDPILHVPGAMRWKSSGSRFLLPAPLWNSISFPLDDSPCVGLCFVIPPHLR